MLRRFLSNLLITLGCVAFAVVGLGPRGAAICIGGGHALGEMIVAACDRGGHMHGGNADAAHTDAHACEHEAAACDVAPSHHHDGEPHGPCADIPLDQDEYRASAGSGVKHVDDGASNSHDAGVAHLAHIALASDVVPRRRSHAAIDVAHVRSRDVLRSVILQV